VKRSSLALLLALAGTAWTLGQALLPDMGLEWPDRLAAVAAARPEQAVSSALFVLAGALLVVAAVSGSRRVRAGRGSRLILAGLLMLGLGGVWLAAGRGAFNLLMYRVSDPEVPEQSALDVLGADQGPGFLVLVLTLPALLLGPVVMAIGAIRGGVGPRGWLGLAGWLAGVGAFVVAEFTVKAVEVGGVALATVALVVLGAVLVRPTSLARRPEPEPAPR
jgi:hypothetical protein